MSSQGGGGEKMVKRNGIMTTLLCQAEQGRCDNTSGFYLAEVEPQKQAPVKTATALSIPKDTSEAYNVGKEKKKRLLR